MSPYQSSFADQENSLDLGLDGSALHIDGSAVGSEDSIDADDNSSELNDSDSNMVLTEQEGYLALDP
jgi:hypothetical protein